MPRYPLTIEYDGSPFVGWQAQTNGLSVQHVLEAGFKGFCGEDVKVNGAGRTDAGVHALGQVAHVDLPREVALVAARPHQEAPALAHQLAGLAGQRRDALVERDQLRAQLAHARADRLHRDAAGRFGVPSLDALRSCE